MALHVVRFADTVIVLTPLAPSVSDGSDWFSVVMVQPETVLSTAVTIATWVRSPFLFCLLRPPHMDTMSPAPGSGADGPEVVLAMPNFELTSSTKSPATSLANSVRPVAAYRNRLASSVGWKPATVSNGVLPAVLRSGRQA